MNIYCGNNGQHPQLLNGTKVLGTRYGCLQKGLQRGNSLPVDPAFLLPYTPIVPNTKYCGNQNNLPNGYTRFGGLHECYLSGIGVGKRLKAEEDDSDSDSDYDPNDDDSDSESSDSESEYGDYKRRGRGRGRARGARGGRGSRGGRGGGSRGRGSRGGRGGTRGRGGSVRRKRTV